MTLDIDDLENGLLFIEVDPFQDLADKYLGEDGRAELQNLLLEDPEAGPMEKETGGARKIRVALPGRGKSGGARVIYYYRKSRFVVYFLTLFPKNEKAALSDDDKKWIKKQIKKINEEDYP